MKKYLTWTLYLFFILSIVMCTPTKNTTEGTTSSSKEETKGSTKTTKVKEIDTGRDASYMTEQEKDMLKEINLMRSNPKGYIPYVETYIKEYQDELVNNELANKSEINEEIKTARELIRVLKKTPKLSILQPHSGVMKAATKHGKDLISTGRFGHSGSDGSMPWDRVKKASPELSDGGENLIVGVKGTRKPVINLLVDKGIPNRGHRLALLNPKWQYGACYNAGTLDDMENLWIQNFGYSKTAAIADAEGSEPTVSPSAGSAPKVEGIDAARKASYLENDEKDMIKEINLMRSDPKGYIAYVEAYIKEQEEDTGWGASHIAIEVKTARELIAELKKTPKLSLLQPHRGIYKAAKRHGKDLIRTGKFGHGGSDGSQPWARIKKEASDLKDGSENLVAGLSTVRSSVINLLVDAGIPDRGHRKNLLNPNWRYVACYSAGKYTTGGSKGLDHLWVQNFGY